MAILNGISMLIFLCLHFVRSSNCETNFCPANPNDKFNECSKHFKTKSTPRFLFYDVNPPEGFNLRRDVYMRLAVMMRKLSQKEDWHLVLPPWPKLYHWRSHINDSQERLPWSLFFDIPSLQRFAPVMDLQQYFEEQKQSSIEQVYILQHFKKEWERGIFEEKQMLEPCNERPPFEQQENGLYFGHFWGYNNITAAKVACLSFHGRALQLGKFLSKSVARTIFIDHAEVVLHENYGDKEYWQARRSMRFSKHLVQRAQRYRQEVLNSTDESDLTIRPDDWQQEKRSRVPIGGPYLCVHMRRRDFLWGRPKEVPSIPSAAQQLQRFLSKFQLNTLFVATDASDNEFQELQSLLQKYNVVKYVPSKDDLLKIKDGGIAIVEQIICSHARFFVGTHESTFSFRINEEREIMGFPTSTTFNRLCGDESNGSCTQPSIWPIVF